MAQLKIKEKQFQAGIVILAEYLKWKVFHTYDSRRSIGAGFPDLVMARHDRLIFAELKTATGRLSKKQKEWGATLDQTEAEYYVWRPEDWDEIEKILE